MMNNHQEEALVDTLGDLVKILGNINLISFLRSRF